MLRENPETDSIKTDDDQPFNGKKMKFDFEIQQNLKSRYYKGVEIRIMHSVTS